MKYLPIMMMFVALVLLAGSTSARPQQVKKPTDQDIMEEQRTGDAAEAHPIVQAHTRRTKRGSWALPNCANPIPNPKYHLEPYWYEQLLNVYNYGGPPYICPSI